NPVHHRPVCSTRPVMSLRPSPSKSPTLTSTQVTLVGQAPQGESVETLLPLKLATHHRPVCSTRPAMSSLPTQVKSPTLTSTQFTTVLREVSKVLVNPEPLDWPIHHCPVSLTRPAK